METKKVILIAFIVVTLAQLFVPFKMIYDKEYLLSKGKAFKFRVVPLDPNDPFRGKYIRLDFVETRFDMERDTLWGYGDPLFVTLGEDEQGFAKIKAVTREKPQNEYSFQARSGYYNNYEHRLTIDYPFDKFYMEESKAPDAEVKYRESLRDTSNVAYALVKVRNGDSVLMDVLINGVSIKEITGQK